MKIKIKKKKPSPPRNYVAINAQFRKAGIMQDRRKERDGSKSWRSLLDKE